MSRVEITSRLSDLVNVTPADLQAAWEKIEWALAARVDASNFKKKAGVPNSMKHADHAPFRLTGPGGSIFIPRELDGFYATYWSVRCNGVRASAGAALSATAPARDFQLYKAPAGGTGALQDTLNSAMNWYTQGTKSMGAKQLKEGDQWYVTFDPGTYTWDLFTLDLWLIAPHIG